MSNTKISAKKNGPFLVENCKSFARQDGKEYEAKPMMALCRCGASNNKPFCDGSHAKIDFGVVFESKNMIFDDFLMEKKFKFSICF